MLHASEQLTDIVQEQRRDFRERMRTWPVKKIKCLDESGAKLGMTRLYGRAAGGERVNDHVRKNYGQSWTMIAMIDLRSVKAPMLLEGAMDTLVFETYLEKQVCPLLHSGDILIMDNLSAHKSHLVSGLIADCGARIEYLPPYSPDLNPIELCWSKVKTFLRAAKAKTAESLLSAVHDALVSVTSSDTRAWFRHVGFAVN